MVAICAGKTNFRAAQLLDRVKMLAAEAKNDGVAKVSFRTAERKDVALILEFIRKLADYEHMLDEVVATPELLWNRPSIDFYLSLGAVPMKDWTVYRLSGETLKKLAE